MNGSYHAVSPCSQSPLRGGFSADNDISVGRPFKRTHMVIGGASQSNVSTFANGFSSRPKTRQARNDIATRFRARHAGGQSRSAGPRVASRGRRLGITGAGDDERPLAGGVRRWGERPGTTPPGWLQDGARSLELATDRPGCRVRRIGKSRNHHQFVVRAFPRHPAVKRLRPPRTRLSSASTALFRTTARL